MQLTSNESQLLARLARYTASKLQVRIMFGSLLSFILFGIIVQYTTQTSTTVFPLLIVLFSMSFGMTWTTYVIGPLARAVLHQQETIAQFQRDLAALHENKS